MNEKRNSGALFRQDSAVDWLRLCTLLLAAVSFWATAQGMSSYVFSEGWQAYAASLAVQGILVGLNFYLPSFWRRISSGPKIWLGALTVVVLLCSSWFSFIYIVERVYKDSWGVDSRLLVQSEYRRQLFRASDYADAYEEYLNGQLSEQVLGLSDRAKKLGTDKFNPTVGINWEEERRRYTGDDFAAKSEMTAVIDAVERATQTENNDNIRTEAMNAVVTLRANITDRLEQMSQQLGYAQDRLDGAKVDLETARSTYSITSSTEGAESTRSTALSILTTAQERVDRLQREVAERESVIADYRTALQRIQFYESSLGIISEGTSYAVSTYLRDIQRELFQSSPDLALLESRASSVLALLQDAMEIAENEDEYQQFFSAMNRFAANLRDAHLIGEIKPKLNAMQEELSDTLWMEANLQGNAMEEAVAVDTTAPGADNAETGENEAVSGNAETREDEMTSVADNVETGENEMASGDGQEALDSAGLGETLFLRQRLDRLKAQIASFPVYMGNENNPTLSSYNRSAASDALDDTIRLYLTNHNAAQQGLIYLASPYRPMAVFSLVLALFLDIAAFVTGILMDGMEQYHKKKDEERTDTETSTEPWSDTDVRESKETQSSAVSPEAHLNRYIYLNGDYVRLGGEITYRAIEDGQEIEINMAQPDMKAGFYVQNEEQWALVQTPQILHLVSNPQDGIYLNRSIRYQQNALSITEASSENQYEFLANVPDNLPIYQIRNGTMTIPSLPVYLLPETHGDTLIVALNPAGTVINAIYIEIQEQ